jgi:hypothetical protein
MVNYPYALSSQQGRISNGGKDESSVDMNFSQVDEGWWPPYSDDDRFITIAMKFRSAELDRLKRRVRLD